jgi:hypothetical protein
MRRGARWWLGLALLLPAAARAQTSPDDVATFGAIVSPTTLPSGSASAYGYGGAPEVGAGYRQGIGPVEVEARARFNYVDVSLAAEGILKYTLFSRGAFDLAPLIGVGIVADTGATYIDSINISYVGLRILPGGVASYRFAETVRGLAELDVPVDLLFGNPGGSRVGFLMGGGAEMYLGQRISVMAMGQAGFEALQFPNTPTQFRFDYLVRLGIGWRLF